MKVVVLSAPIQDRDGAKVLLRALLPIIRLLRIWADAGYHGALIEWCEQAVKVVLEIVAASPTHKGFVLLPRRWVVERTFAWLSNYRRLSKRL